MCRMADGLRFFDAHCHLQDARLASQLGQVLEEARAAGVERLACNGVCEADWDQARHTLIWRAVFIESHIGKLQVERIADEHASVVPNFGLHPWWVGTRSSDWLAKLRDKLERCPRAGLGECGLDAGKRGRQVPLEDQEAVFLDQLRLSKELRRPISVHCVRAFSELLQIVKQEGPWPQGLILHSWAGPASFVKPLAAISGIYFSLSGHTMQMSLKKCRPMLQQIPLDRLLLETDSPDALPPNAEPLSPDDPSPGEVANRAHNHPANIRMVLDYVARLTGNSKEDLAAVALENAKHIFSLCD